MNNLSNFPTQELEQELQKRGKTISPTICPTCRIYTARMSDYSIRPPALHCDGCMKVCEKCTCRR